ncbi:MAG: cell envelope biogenesis protein OmpA, partial [Deltaproteobacteria bacterium]|nr:cell envelope biogenesis protein OmpA [Deltaproteobacteria bacterium]
MVLALTLGVAACGGGGDNFPDANDIDANTIDGASADLTPPETVLDPGPASPNNLATVHLTFSATDDTVPLDVTFACILDGAAVTPCASPIDLAIAADGDHTFTVAATDHAGNTDATPATATWTTDRTPPDTALVDMPPALDNSADVQFAFTATEAGTFECQLDGAGFAPCSTPHDVTALASGSHTFDVRAIDAVGNVDPSPATWTWTIDLTTPNTVIDAGPTGTVAATTATFAFSSPNAGAGATFDCALDGAALAPCGSTSTISYSGLAEGDHTFAVRVTTMAGTPDPTPAEQTWTVDLTAPVVTITTGPTGLTADSTPSFDFTTSGNPTTIECKIDSAAFASCGSPFTAAALVDGGHTLVVRAIDAAGNTGSDTRAFTVDTTAPDTTIVTGPGSPTAATSATFTFASTEAGTFECALDGAAFAACPTPTSFTGLADAVHVLRVRAVDAVGNADGSPATFAWTVDTVGPTTAITSSPSNPDGSTSATFTYTASESPATYECSLDGAAFASCPVTGKSYAGLTDVSHSFRVRAKDAAGNTGAITTFTWVVDTTAPTIAFTGGPIDPTPTSETAPTFTFAVGGSATSTSCKVDADAFGPCTTATSHTTGALAEGAHTIQLQVSDAVGNTAATAPRPFTIDTIAPTVAFTGGPIDPLATNDATPTFAFVTGGAPASTQCKVDGGAFGACTTAASHTTAALADGGHAITVRVTDAAGNSAATAPRTFTIDTAPPTTTLVTTPPSLATVNNATFTYAASEIGTFECKLDAGAFTGCASSGQSYTGLAEGSHTFQVRATDAPGNVDATPATYTWLVDTVPPLTSIVTTPTNPSGAATAAFTYAANEAGASFECKLDAAPFAGCASTGQSYASLADGTHTFQVRAVDTAGNVDGSPAMFTWLVDTTMPTTTILTNPSDPSAVTTAAFTYAANEAGASFECRLDGAAFAVCATTGQSYTSLADGTHTFQVRAKDAAGNLDATPASYTWAIDTIAPTTTIATHPVNPSAFPNAAFTYASSEAGSTFECKLDNAAFVSCASTGQNYTSLADGMHVFAVRAIDAAGNVAATPATFTWTIDTVAPVATITATPSNPSTSASATFAYTANEAGATFECRLDSAATFTACPASYSGLADGSHTFRVRAIDLAGNTGAAATFTWTIDTVAPVATITATP